MCRSSEYFFDIDIVLNPLSQLHNELILPEGMIEITIDFPIYFAKYLFIKFLMITGCLYVGDYFKRLLFPKPHMLREKDG